MQRYDGHKELPSGWQPCVVAIGIFDGVHRGHQVLLKRALVLAKELQCQAAVYTFFPHPARVLSDHGEPKLLESLDTRLDHFSQMGFDACIVEPFNKTFAQISAKEFIKDILVNKLCGRAVVVGEGFHFGASQQGTTAMLLQHAKHLNFAATIVTLQKLTEHTISSTNIRRAIVLGEIKTANEFLGRPFMLHGRVIHGDGRGRTLGFPTANLDYDAEVLPATGVYATWSLGKFGKVMSVTNVGSAPTFARKNLRVECFLLDFSRDLYGELLTLQFVDRIRSEQKFSDITVLKKQIEDDIRQRRILIAQS